MCGTDRVPQAIVMRRAGGQARAGSAHTNLGGGETLLGSLDDQVNDLLGREVVLQPLQQA